MLHLQKNTCMRPLVPAGGLVLVEFVQRDHPLHLSPEIEAIAPAESDPSTYYLQHTLSPSGSQFWAVHCPPVLQISIGLGNYPSVSGVDTANRTTGPQLQFPQKSQANDTREWIKSPSCLLKALKKDMHSHA